MGAHKLLFLNRGIPYGDIYLRQKAGGLYLLSVLVLVRSSTYHVRLWQNS